VHGAEQYGEWVGDFDRVLAELEADLWATEVEVVAAQGDDAGDALAVEQDQAARDAGGQLERVVVEQRAGLAQAGGVIDRGAGGLRRRPLDVQGGEQVGVVGPVEEVACGQRSARRVGDPLVEQRLAQLLEREALVLEPGGEPDRGAQLGVAVAVAARARSVTTEFARELGPELPAGVGREVRSGCSPVLRSVACAQRSKRASRSSRASRMSFATSQERR
jgi:hypothetical protein